MANKQTSKVVLFGSVYLKSVEQLKAKSAKLCSFHCSPGHLACTLWSLASDSLARKLLCSIAKFNGRQREREREREITALLGFGGRSLPYITYAGESSGIELYASAPLPLAATGR